MPSLSFQIAAAGLEQWHPGTGAHAQEFLDAVLLVMDDPKKEREFVRSAPFGITDARWVEVVCRTCIFAIYDERNNGLNIEGIENVFKFTQLNTLGCRCGHEAFDQFTALSSDPIWKMLHPPFDWMCGCELLRLMDMDVSSPDEASRPAAGRLGSEVLEKITTWMQRSPETVFNLL